MTVNYSSEVFTASGSYRGIFLSLLARWRGSIYRLVWFDLSVFVGLYYALSFSYRYALISNFRNDFLNSTHKMLVFSTGFSSRNQVG